MVILEGRQSRQLADCAADGDQNDSEDRVSRGRLLGAPETSVPPPKGRRSEFGGSRSLAVMIELSGLHFVPLYRNEEDRAMVDRLAPCSGHRG
jgi:hypothetical protein